MEEYLREEKVANLIKLGDVRGFLSAAMEAGAFYQNDEILSKDEMEDLKKAYKLVRDIYHKKLDRYLKENDTLTSEEKEHIKLHTINYVGLVRFLEGCEELKYLSIRKESDEKKAANNRKTMLTGCTCW